MAQVFWRSLRSRILLLTVLTLLFLAGAAASFFAYLRSSHAATLTTAERHLITVGTRLVHSYIDRAGRKPALESVKVETSEPHPPPPPPVLEEPISKGSDNPRPPRLHPHPPGLDPFSPLTAEVLRQEPGIEGGFFAANQKALIGYAFPTHEGPGPSKEMPKREQPTIEKLVQDAVASGAVRTTRFEGPHDAVLFVAIPIQEAQGDSKNVKIAGAVWLMQRLPGVSGGRNRQLLLGSLGFGAAALITALLTFFVTTEVRSGVHAVLARLESFEGGIFGHPRPLAATTQLAEFDKVLRGIDALGSSLQQRIESQRALESEMRHKERLSALGQFAAGIAHELRNPLATVRLRTQMSQRTPEPEAVVRNSSVILEEIDRLDNIIGRLLYFSRPIHLDLEPVSLDDLCSSTSAAWSQREAAANVDVVCQANAGFVIRCDRSRMLQVLDNLAENAVHASSGRSTGKGKVTIATAEHEGFAVISVHDNGPGLSPEATHHALDPFFTTKDAGTGLGLSISFEIVQAHGGDLQITNHEDGGAVASVRLPLTVTHSGQDYKGEPSHV